MGWLIFQRQQRQPHPISDPHFQRLEQFDGQPFLAEVFNKLVQHGSAIAAKIGHGQENICIRLRHRQTKSRRESLF